MRKYSKISSLSDAVARLLAICRPDSGYCTIGSFLVFWLKMYKAYFKYFKCPNCKAKLRVPKGKGRLNITCPKCRTMFHGKTWSVIESTPGKQLLAFQALILLEGFAIFYGSVKKLHSVKLFLGQMGKNLFRNAHWTNLTYLLEIILV